MGFFSSSVSEEEIHTKVMSHMHEYLGVPEDFGQQGFEEKYKNMLLSLNEWAVSLKLGTWKKCSIIGSIEASLRNTFRGHALYFLVDRYIELANKTIR